MFVEGPIGAALVHLAIPIIFGNILQTGYQLSDAFFWFGRLGGAAVAAVSISFPVTFVVIALGAGLAIAGAILSAQYMGAGRLEKDTADGRGSAGRPGLRGDHRRGDHRRRGTALRPPRPWSRRLLLRLSSEYPTARGACTL
jgi:MatE